MDEDDIFYDMDDTIFAQFALIPAREITREGAGSVLADIEAETLDTMQRLVDGLLPGTVGTHCTDGRCCQFIRADGTGCASDAVWDLRVFLDTINDWVASHCQYMFCSRVHNMIDQIITNSLLPAIDRTVSNGQQPSFAAGECCKVCGKHLHTIKLRLMLFGGVKAFEKIWEGMFVARMGMGLNDVKALEKVQRATDTVDQ